MFTDPQKLRKNDPGRPEICPVFMYHKIFTQEEKVKEIERDCRSGKLGCVECKRTMLGGLEEFLSPIRERRRRIEGDIDKLEAVFIEGSIKARNVAIDTMEEVREAMNLK